MIWSSIHFAEYTIIRINKSSRIREVGQVARMGDEKCVKNSGWKACGKETTQ
jgi:hypothetical protein